MVAEEKTRPNILFILVDDQRNDVLGCYGHPLVQTPNIDQLAQAGVRFENAFVQSPMCMPSRVTTLTSLCQRSHGCVNPALIKESDALMSYPAMLKKSGYRTAHIGKIHYSFENDAEVESRMYDDFQVIPRPYVKKQPDGSFLHSEEMIHRASLEFLNKQTVGNPFCLTVSFNMTHAEDNLRAPGYPHYPWPSVVEDSLYAEQQMILPHLKGLEYFNALPGFIRNSMNRRRFFWRWDTPEKYQINMKAYLRCATAIDRMLGEYRRVLADRGLAENTVILYTADNGMFLGNRELAGKWSHFEESLRIPLIVYDPRQAHAGSGRVEPAMASNLDLAPTFLDYAGVKIPERYQGRSLVPLVREERSISWRKDIYCEHLLRLPSIPKWEGVRTERYLYACYFEQTPAYEFLYDLRNDPDELQNLALNEEYSSVLKELRSRCREYKKEYPEIADR